MSEPHAVEAFQRDLRVRALNHAYKIAGFFLAVLRPDRDLRYVEPALLQAGLQGAPGRAGEAAGMNEDAGAAFSITHASADCHVYLFGAPSIENPY